MGIFDNILAGNSKKSVGEEQSLINIGGEKQLDYMQSYQYSPTNTTKTFNTKTTTTSSVDARQYTSTYAPSLQIVEGSSNVSGARVTSSPTSRVEPQLTVAPSVRESGSVAGASQIPTQSPRLEGGGTSLIGGGSGSLLVLGAIAVGGYILIKKAGVF